MRNWQREGESYKDYRDRYDRELSEQVDKEGRIAFGLLIIYIVGVFLSHGWYMNRFPPMDEASWVNHIFGTIFWPIRMGLDISVFITRWP